MKLSSNGQACQKYPFHGAPWRQHIPPAMVHGSMLATGMSFPLTNRFNAGVVGGGKPVVSC
jgi:hypothetical protein